MSDEYPFSNQQKLFEQNGWLKAELERLRGDMVREADLLKLEKRLEAFIIGRDEERSKVLMGELLARPIRATTVDESIPPERNAPNGTSVRIRSATDCWISRSSSSMASRSVPSNGLLSPSAATERADQYRVVVGSARAALSSTIVPGSTLQTSSTMHWSFGMTA